MRKSMLLATVLAQKGVRTVTLPQNLLDTPEVTIESFETFAEWVKSGNGTIEDNATQYADGTHSIKFTPDTGTAVIATKAGISFNFTNYNTVLAKFYLHAGLVPNFNYCTSIQFTATGLSGSHNAYNALVKSSAWNTVWSPKSKFTLSSGNWSTPATTLRVTVLDSAQSGDDDVIGSVDKLTACAGHPVIMVMFDDQHAGAYEKGYPYMKARGIKGTMYVTSNNVDDVGYMTSAQLQELYAEGWDMANHTQSHLNMATSEQAAIEAELTGCETFLDNLGLTRASNHVAYPNYVIGANGLAAMTATGMLTGRIGAVPNANFVTPAVHLYGLPVWDPTKWTVEELKAHIDQAILDGQICPIYFHNIADTVVNATLDYATADFQEVIDYILTKRLQPITISEFYAATTGEVTVTVPRSF